VTKDGACNGVGSVSVVNKVYALRRRPEGCLHGKLQATQVTLDIV